MRNYGLYYREDGKDVCRIQWYKKEQYGIDADIDGISLSPSDFEGIDGAPIGEVDMSGWSMAETLSIPSNAPLSFSISKPITSGTVPTGPKQPVSTKQVDLSDVDDFFSIPIPRKRSRSPRRGGRRHHYRRY